MNLLPFSKIEHHSLQLVVWVSRLFFIVGSALFSAGIFRELSSIYKWLASPIYNDEKTAWHTYRYKLDLLHTNWNLIALGLLLIFAACYLIVKVNGSNKA